MSPHKNYLTLNAQSHETSMSAMFEMDTMKAVIQCKKMQNIQAMQLAHSDLLCCDNAQEAPQSLSSPK